MDSADNENEDVGIGLNAFVNKLPGGRRLRNRVRKAVAQNATNLKSDMASTDPSGKYTGNIIK